MPGTMYGKKGKKSESKRNMRKRLGAQYTDKEYESMKKKPRQRNTKSVFDS